MTQHELEKYLWGAAKVLGSIIDAGDTLVQPVFLKNDPYERNLWGAPPQGCADYAFQQHI